MTAQAALWIASSAGAALFFTAGFLARWRFAPSARPRGSGELAPSARPRGSGELAPAIALGDEAHRSQEAEEALRAELSQLADDRRRAQSRAGAAEAEATRLERELVTQKRALAALGRERDEARERLRQRDKMLRELMAERDELAGRARATDNLEASAARADASDGERQRLALELEAARGREAEVDVLRDENADLRAKADERDQLAERVAELASEVEVLRAHKFAAEASAPRAARGSSPGGTGQALEELLHPLARRAGMRAAVLADDLGLPIVGLGDHAQGLAAFAGLADELAAKAVGFLPIGGVRRVEVEGEGRLTLSALPARAGGPALSLVTMSVGALPAPELRGVVERSAAILA